METDESLGLAGILEGGTRRSAAAVAAAAAASTAPKTGSNLVEAGDGRGLMSSRKTGEVGVRKLTSFPDFSASVFPVCDVLCSLRNWRISSNSLLSASAYQKLWSISPPVGC